MMRGNLRAQARWLVRAFQEFKNPDYYFLVNKGVKVTEQKVFVRLKKGGGGLYARHRGDALVINEIFLGRVYDEAFTGAKTMIDIGANIGAASMRAYQLGVKEITAYEPHPDNALLLFLNIGGFAAVHEAAVGDKEGFQQLYGSRSDGSPSLLFGDGPGVRVRVVRLRRPQCDVLKVDAEGMESRILRSMDLSRVKRVITESEDFKLDSYLQKKGYRTKRTGNTLYARKE